MFLHPVCMPAVCTHRQWCQRAVTLHPPSPVISVRRQPFLHVGDLCTSSAHWCLCTHARTSSRQRPVPAVILPHRRSLYANNLFFTLTTSAHRLHAGISSRRRPICAKRPLLHASGLCMSATYHSAGRRFLYADNFFCLASDSTLATSHSASWYHLVISHSACGGLSFCMRFVSVVSSLATLPWLTGALLCHPLILQFWQTFFAGVF